MPINSLDNNINQINNILFEKGNYVFFDSANTFNYNPFAYYTKDTIHIERGIIEEVKDGNVFIICRDRKYDQKEQFKRRASQVKLISKTQIYLRYSEEPRVPWYGSEVCKERCILQFDSEGHPAGYLQTKSTLNISTKFQQQQQVVQHKLIPTIDTPPPLPTKPSTYITTLILHWPNQTTPK